MQNQLSNALAFYSSEHLFLKIVKLKILPFLKCKENPFDLVMSSSPVKDLQQYV